LELQGMACMALGTEGVCGIGRRAFSQIIDRYHEKMTICLRFIRLIGTANLFRDEAVRWEG